MPKTPEPPSDGAHGYLAPDPDGGLHWGPLVSGTLLKRYKRFLADVELADGAAVTAHTPNTGAMTGCSEPGRRVWLSRHDRPGRKYPYTWEMIEMPSALVGVDTGVPNRLVGAAARAGRIRRLPFPATARSEVKYGGSRLDLMLEPADGPKVYVEIKNCTLAENGIAYFPDAVTARGTKHLLELADIAASGNRAAIFILAQRGDADRFSPADHIDPQWGATLRRVLNRGVELIVHRADLDMRKISLGRELPAVL